MLILEYTNWSNFKSVLLKVQLACENSGHDPTNHFVGPITMVAIKHQNTDLAAAAFASFVSTGS